jgi:hypothetical protein
MVNDLKQPLNTSWWVVVRTMAITGLIMAAVVALKAREDQYAGMASAFLALWLSMAVFFSLRWRKLRTDLASGACTADEFRSNPTHYLFGPRNVTTWWFVATVAVVILLTVLSALRWGPYA